MSIAAMAWAWKQDVGGTEKLVLLALADHADDHGLCWPGKAGVAEKCGLGRRTVVAAVQRLEAANLVARQVRYRDDGSQTSDLIRLQIPEQSPAPPRAADAPPPARELHPPRAADAPRTEPSSETSMETENTSLSARADDAECFAYWQERCGKPKAKFTAERQKKVRARRHEGYTLQDIRQGIDGAATNPPRDRDSGVVYDDLVSICRNGAQLERYMERAAAPVVPIRPRRESPSDLLRALRSSAEEIIEGTVA